MVNRFNISNKFDAIITDPPFGFAVQAISSNKSVKSKQGYLIATQKIDISQIIT